MAGKDKKEKSQLRQQTEELLLSPLPILGDYRQPEFQPLVLEATSILYERFYESGNMKLCRASCCMAWGQNNDLKNKGHPVYSIHQASGKESLHIDSRMDLFKAIVGPEPPEDKPWIVRLPRTLVKCQQSQPDLQDLDNQDHKGQGCLVFRKSEHLGKRAILELDYPPEKQDQATEADGKLG